MRRAVAARVHANAHRPCAWSCVRRVQHAPPSLWNASSPQMLVSAWVPSAGHPPPRRALRRRRALSAATAPDALSLPYAPASTHRPGVARAARSRSFQPPAPAVDHLHRPRCRDRRHPRGQRHSGLQECLLRNRRRTTGDLPPPRPAASHRRAAKAPWARPSSSVRRPFPGGSHSDASLRDAAG